MPTGYTAKLMESGQTFREFALDCARAFGACITMRDEDASTPIPDRFQPSDYNLIRLAESKAGYLRLQAMTNDERISYGNFKKCEAVANAERWIAKEVEENQRLLKMELNVLKWTPPSTDHEELKAFMLQQIAVSKGDVARGKRSLDEILSKPPMDFYAECNSSALQQISYHEKEYAKEVELANSRTEWVQKLRDSLT